MSHYRRSRIEGGTFFFTVALANRRSHLLTERIGVFRAAYGKAQKATPFKTLAICVLPDHLHAVWRLPEGDGDFSLRWSQIKAGFSHALPSQQHSASKVAKRETSFHRYVKNGVLSPDWGGLSFESAGVGEPW
jgi:putative transposase